ncbi:MAG TPA: exopolyphosphatase [Pseudoclavibacter sp.]|nr:exopolyphosphatase [Pseudoclavibacter sp.]
MIRAGIDCGTNSIRLLVLGDNGEPLARRNTITRLGHGVDRTGAFDPERVAASIQVVRGYAEECRRLGVQVIRFGATSATRDATNREIFTTPVTRILGVAPEVIPGTEEAALSFRGAIGSLPGYERYGCVVVDLGGGSTEIVEGTGTAGSAYSMNVGSVRLTERWMTDALALSAAQREAVIADVTAALDEALQTVRLKDATRLVGVSGTIATVTAYALTLAGAQPTELQGVRLSLEEVLGASDALSRMSVSELGALAFIHPGRVGVTAVGALIWHTVVSRIVAECAARGHVIKEVTTSLNDILDGLTLTAVAPFSPGGDPA